MRFWTAFALFALTACCCPSGSPTPNGDPPSAEAVAKVLAQDKEFVAAVAKAGSDIETRVRALEDRVKGIGYAGLLTGTSADWVPAGPGQVRCYGNEATPRDFDSKPSIVKLDLGWRTGTPTPPALVQVGVFKKNTSGGPGDKVFDEKIPFKFEPTTNEQQGSIYTFRIPISCNEVYRLDVGIDDSDDKR